MRYSEEGACTRSEAVQADTLSLHDDVVELESREYAERDQGVDAAEEWR